MFVIHVAFCYELQKVAKCHCVIIHLYDIWLNKIITTQHLFLSFFTLAPFAAQPLHHSLHPFRRTYPKGLSSDTTGAEEKTPSRGHVQYGTLQRLRAPRALLMRPVNENGA